MLAAAIAGHGPATAAQGKEPEAEKDPSIVVTGSRPEREQVRREARQFVRRTGVAPGERPAARWVVPVCPRAIGIEPAHAAIVEARIREVADAIGASVAGKSCDANIAVVFTRDGGRFVRRIAQQSPKRMAEVPIEVRDALHEGPAPVRWWYATGVASRYGTPASMADDPGTGGYTEGGEPVIPSGIPTISSYNGGSIISTGVARGILSATVVVDVDRADGRTLDQIASYAAFVALAEIRAGKVPPAGSILGLFDAGDAAREMTDRDIAFLSALYRLQLDRTALRHRNGLTGALADAAEP